MLPEKRYPHYLKRARGGRWPARVVCVDCVGQAYEYDPDMRVATEHMLGWSAVSLLLEDRAYHYHSELAGQERWQWWALVYDLLCWPGDTWIISYQCDRVWPLLGVWGQLESGGLTLAPDQDRARHLAAEHVRKVRRKAPDPLAPIGGAELRRAERIEQGWIVAEGKPAILVASMPDTIGRLVWVDCRNYSVGDGWIHREGLPTARALAAWWREWSDALRALSLGSAQHTAGSQALHGYRAGYYDGGIYCHAHASAAKLEAEGYYGGRCECYRLGVVPGKTVHLDYRSLYPWVMIDRGQPVRIEGWTDAPDVAEKIVRERPIRCLARVTVETERPLFPYRRDSGIIYPVGRFTTVLPGPELEEAVERGCVTRYHEVAWYTLGQPLAAYARVLYQCRTHAELHGKEHMANCYKSLLVSLPGKLGQRIKRWLPAYGVPPDYPWGIWYGPGPDGKPTRYRCLGSQVQWEYVGGYATEAVPQIAAWITSAGRVRLLESIEAAGWERTYYCDTDCIVTDYQGFVGCGAAELVAKCEIGKLRIKHDAVTTEIRGAKYYLVGDQVICAGLPFGDRRDARDGRHYWYRQSPAEAIRRGQRPDAGEELREYHRAGEYRHGVVHADGRVTPIRLEEP